MDGRHKRSRDAVGNFEHERFPGFPASFPNTTVAGASHHGGSHAAREEDFVDHARTTDRYVGMLSQSPGTDFTQVVVVVDDGRTTHLKLR